MISCVNSVYEFSKVSDLDAILDMLHDQWFDLGGLKYNDKASELTLLFEVADYENADTVLSLYFIKLKSTPVCKVLLTICGVESYSVKDVENIGKYDLNEITYAADTKSMMITSTIPLYFTVNVSKFLIKIEFTNEILFRKKYFKIF